MKIDIHDTPKTFKERVNVSIVNGDVWSMDTNLAYVILPMLVHLREVKQGIPMEFANVGGHGSEQYCFDFYCDSYKSAFELGVSKWETVMDKMIWSFSQIIVTNWSKKYYHGHAVYQTEEIEPGIHKVHDTNPNDHWHDHIGEQLHSERIQEGLELFGKYFKNLFT